MAEAALGASFRDPGGFVFEREGEIYRRVHPSYADDYDHLLSSGLYDALVRDGLLVPHEETRGSRGRDGAHVVLRPERIPFVSYPYEWCFGQLRDAALCTLRVQRRALEFGMTLKDASAYNVQFRGGRPVFIDTLSFARALPGSPWAGYRQYCQHFLAPLALIAHRDVRLAQLLRVHLDGIPLDLACRLLPARAWLDPHLLLHLRIHARFQRRYAARPEAVRAARPLREGGLRHLVSALERATARLAWRPAPSAWSRYDEAGSYSSGGLAHKRELVAAHLDRIAPTEVWDLGANAGAFSRLSTARGIRTVAFDADPACVERAYRETRGEDDTLLLPLLLDLASPSPALGWACGERSSLLDRRSADAVLALALVHHLAIGHNVPLERIASLLASLAPHAIVEFVPKSDPKVRELLTAREDVFPSYTRQGFEAAFGRCFEICEGTRVKDSERVLYRLQRRARAA